MKELLGTGVSPGAAIGELRFIRQKSQQIQLRHIEDVAAEVQRFKNAKTAAIQELAALYEQALSRVGEEEALLFEIHQMMLEDEDYCTSILDIITKETLSAEYAVSVTADQFSQMFSEMEGDYIKARAADVKDISGRLIKLLTGGAGEEFHLDSPAIIAADDLSPSETIQLDKDKILAFVTRLGSSNSHTSILARTMGIPAVIGLGDQLSDEDDGKRTSIDGSSGLVLIEPDAAAVSSFSEKRAEAEARQRVLSAYKGKPSVTKDGKRILTYANIGNPSDLDLVLANDAEGIGLFRSEFLYLESSDYPTEEQQFQAYKRVAERMGGRRVIFRTLDIGADKQAAYFRLPREENPAMGLRAIRICLTRPEVFETQLRAMYRASAFGKVAIMFPMITSLWEVQKAKETAREVRDSLLAEGVTVGQSVEIGIMVETPAAALISDELAREVDFFSIGTNDLTQYTLALDRQNESLGRFYDPHHPAVLDLIRLTVQSSHRHGIWTGICGELAADLSLTETFLAMGVDELSVAPPFILPLREKIRNLSTE